MRIQTTRFGEIDISESSILHMPDGMLGFSMKKKFVLLEDQPDTLLKWLQAVDDPALAFIVINPMDFFVDYDVELSDEDVKFLDLKDPSEAAIVTTVTVDNQNGHVTTNLLGPVVINSRSLCAKQIVLQDEKYGTKHLIGVKASSDSNLETAAAA